MSVASFVAAKRTDHGVPHLICCRALGVSQSWFYKWREWPPTSSVGRNSRRRQGLLRRVGGHLWLARVLEDLHEWGWKVSKTSVEASMARQACGK